jgi:isopentenyl diphosphate isomerase/L-lactate dehydrogenase-like FMN-dependent dehydrogenase
MKPVNLLEYEDAAREKLPQPIFDFIAGGAEDEITLRRNAEAYQRIQLRPRVLVDVSHIDASTEILGRAVSLPVLFAPVALQRAAHPDGELATARAAADAGAIMVLSTLASTSLEEVAAAAYGPRWLQLYVHPDREVSARLVARAERSGYSAICLTVDVPYLGRRERDFGNNLAFPEDIVYGNYVDEPGVDESLTPAGGSSVLAAAATVNIDASLAWKDIAWLKSLTDLPLVIKGILTAEDARLAVEHGAAGIVVSNHGGRQLDGVQATIDALPGIVEAADGRIEVLVDGGIRRGTDVLKALALGAKAVLIGRPYIWGLAVDGEAGVAHVIAMLRDELQLAMALAGCTAISDIDRNLVRF